jgi:outer membrane receptor protein involved in Fe transport
MVAFGSSRAEGRIHFGRLRSRLLASLLAATTALSSPALAQDVEPTPAPPPLPEAAPVQPPGSQSVPLPTVRVEAPRPKPPARTVTPRQAGPRAPRAAEQTPPAQGAQPGPGQASAGPPTAASELTVSGAEINAIPVARVGEVLEMTPGLIVSQHSGEGKANQYFLRGFALDHGTDFAVNVDGMPVNMRTHGHGQGYTDINFLIPELIKSMNIRKGPYFADEGDFSSAGAARISYIDRLDPGLAQVTFGSFGYQRLLAAKSYPAWAGNFLVAAEVQTYNGPWDVPDNVRKVSGVLRYSQGTADDGFSITGMGYVNRWTATDQIPARAVSAGLIGPFGTLDPTDGGKTSRFSISSRFAHTSDIGITRLDAYAIRSDLTLFNNFTYFLNDPVNGDQFSQLDKRTILGFDGSHTFKGRLGPFESEMRIGLQGRYDDIDVGLVNTLQRATLSTVRLDHVNESNLSPYAQNSTKWTDWLRTVVGIRADWFAGKVVSDTPANSGSAGSIFGSPKFSLILGPFYKTELYLNAGTGFHSNDLRAVTITVNPPNAPDAGSTALAAPLLIRSKGAEVGVRSKIIPGLESSLALFLLDFDSELQFQGDSGTTTAGRPSRRVGVEWVNHYQPVPWLAFDLDFAATRARFTDDDPAGNFIPGAPAVIASAAVTIGQKTGWFGAAKFRYLGPRPLIEDDSVRSGPMRVVNANVGYRFENGVRVQLDVLNLFNSTDHQIDYFYASRLPGEPLEGVNDVHFHPIEPLVLRLTVAGKI